MLGTIAGKMTVLAGLWLLVMAVPAAQGQTGYLQGYVLREQGHDTVNGITVRLDYLGTENGTHRTAVTSNGGQFSFNDLPVGFYSVNADLYEFGFAEDVIEIVPRTTTFVTLLLHRPYGWTEYSPTFSLRGRVSVTTDSGSGVHYYSLDVGANSTPDYRLIFGPPWYDMPAMQRPVGGQRVWISGSLFSYSDPPMIIVHSIDNSFWRDSTDHGGAGGAQQHGMQCPLENYQRIEYQGNVLVREITPPPQDSTVYMFSILDSLLCFLDFGDESYHVENGASKPTVDGSHTIIGGYYNCPLSALPRIIVYELDGLFWREPGDTSGFGWAPLDAPEINPAAAADFLLLRNYPNPFNATTRVMLTVPRSNHVELTVFDLTGRRQSELYNGFLTQGSHTFEWNGADRPSGVYFCRAFWNSEQSTVRMLLIR